MSDYQALLIELKDRMCQRCMGTGKIDDAEPGDISFREWTCSACRGSGLKPDVPRG